DYVDVTAFVVRDGNQTRTYKAEADVPADLRARREDMIARAKNLTQPGRFLVDKHGIGFRLRVEGTIEPDRSWRGLQIIITDNAGQRRYDRLEDVPEPYQGQARELTVHQGVEEVGLVSYWREHGRLPRLDWAMVAAFAAIAGAGGLTNTLYSSFARD